MGLKIIAYGRRHGTHPLGMHLRYDMRKLKNPHHDRKLRSLTGLHPSVQAEVRSSSNYEELMERIVREVTELLAKQEAVCVGVYCTGGRHRSVSVALALRDHFVAAGTEVELLLRDEGHWA
jgi:UPF0042 nucleotide-binding protein